MRTVACRLASVFAVWLFASPAVAGHSFSISASADSPDSVRSDPAGPRLLYLWLHCGDDGLSAFEGALLTNLQVLGFTPAAGIVNAGSGTSLSLGMGGCREAPTVLGHWSVLDTGGHVCLGPVVTAVDCASPNPAATLMPKVTGFSSTSDLPCEVGSKPCSAEAEGFVLGYGNVIEPPYEFSGEGSDTLRLNGYPYYPRSATAPPPVLAIPPEVASFSDAASQIMTEALAAARRFSDDTSRAEAMIAVYSRSPMVESVKANPDHTQVLVIWAASPFTGVCEVIDLNMVDASTAETHGVVSEDRSTFHAALIDQFETITGIDGFVLFGSEYFVVGGNAVDSAAMRRALRNLSRSESASAALDGTPLAQEPLRSDVLKVNHSPAGGGHP